MTGWQNELQLIMTQSVWHIALVFARVSAAVSVMPGFGGQAIATRVKLGIAVVFTVLVYPAAPLANATPAPIEFLRTVSSEVVIGLAMGIGIRLWIMALMIAGSMAAQATSLSHLVGNSGVDPMPAIGQVLVVSGLALAMQLGFHVHAARLFLMSYDAFPISTFPPPMDLSRWGLEQAARAFGSAFSFAGPFIIVSALYNLMLGVINRAMPQLMVAFVGAPVITFGGLFILFVAAPIILLRWSDDLFMYFIVPIGSGP